MRCMPQVHGAARDALGYARGVLEIEINSATDNPLVFPDGAGADADPAARDRWRTRHLGRQLPRPAGGPGARLRRARDRRAGLDQRTPHGAAHRRAALRAAAVPGRGRRPQQRHDAAPVHGRRAGLGEQGPGPPRLGRLDPDRAPTRRTTSRWARSRRAMRATCWPTRERVAGPRAALRRHRASTSASADGRRPGAGVAAGARPHARARVAASRARTATPGPTSRPPSSSSTSGTLLDLLPA